MIDRRRLDAVDAALESARRDAGEAELPPSLRARILAATRPLAVATPRARLVDFALRAAAVAAAFAAVLLVAPVPLAAAEFDVKPIVEMNARIAESVASRLPSLDVSTAEVPDVSAATTWPLAAAAVVLLGGGLLLARKDARR